jgi:hypothetical protein
MKYIKRMNWKFDFDQVKRMAIENPVKAGLIVLGVIIAVWVIFSALEIGPEVERAGNGAALGADGNLLWLGMEVGDITRGARQEFKIPKKVRGVFVINEGVQEAKKFGILAGDIICSVNRRDVPSKRAFVNAAKNVKYSDGIMLDIFRDNKYLVVTIPFEYQYGPLLGPNKGHWQLGSPSIGKALPYGRLIDRR